ncbi:hypothetical protein BJ170DRAFT_659563 [Xylariales sp. AK1849]|nr:hypothetical protein BJ170DRAFT_659563 [Xylariales sp. AK1849]
MAGASTPNRRIPFILCSLWFSLAAHGVWASHYHENHHHRSRDPIEPPGNSSDFLSLNTSTSAVGEPSSLGSVSIDQILSRELFIRADTGGQTSSSSSSGDFTCGPDKECSNGACCGESGWCGYSPTYCGDGCVSNCDAEAECGQYAKVPGTTCPLNVCCSEFGFCGTTSDFCGGGCQSDCDQPEPNAATTNTQTRIIAYWESWNSNHPCGNMEPSEIPVYDITHLIFAFGYITPDDFKITAMDGVDAQLLDDVGFLKNKNQELSIMIALGGWTFTDPGTYQNVFTDMVSKKENRSKFITNLLGFLSQYGFDGVDFDWEYPGADDRGGNADDGTNYTELLKELKSAIKSSGKDYIVTFTAPTSYWYLQHFDLENMSQYADWINLMAYDLHGVWDSDDPIGSQVLAHTNLTEIDLALDLFWRNNIPPSDIVLGLGLYGRSFKLSDSSCWKPGCGFSGAGDEGDCTQTAGILSYREIMDILDTTNAKPYYDKDAAVNYLVYGQNNWISYDDNTSFTAKIDFANDKGLGGLMMWAIDLDDAKHTALSAITGNSIESDDDDDLSPLSDKSLGGSSTIGHSTSDSSQCRVTDCGGFCTQSETAVGRVKTYFGDHSTSCDSKSEARYVCCPAWTSLTADQCYWNAGGGAVKTDCSGKCDVGDIKLFDDSWGWTGDLRSGDYDYRCLRGSKVFCCQAGNMKQYLNICSWTECGGSCPSDLQHVLTVDSGGAIGNTRCDDYSNGDVFTNPAGYSNDDSDPTKGSSSHRKLCCPSANSFTNCNWKASKVCSEQCDNGQITLDLDPQGDGGYYCDNGRQQVYCCDPPGGTDQPFLPVDLDKIFPPEYLPAADAKPQFELVNFGGGIGLTDPNETGFAFFLLAGSSTAVSSMSKRDNPGIHFLDCPADILQAPTVKLHVARVICLGHSPDDCFGVRLNGVEGTIVHMPQECGNGTYVRAVSLEPSRNQAVPVQLAMENPTSAVYDFTFDYNTALVRRDAGTISIRMDYSNVKGYWDAVVNSDGINSKRRDLEDIVDRFYSSNKDDWYKAFDSLDTTGSTSLNDLVFSDKTIDHLVYFDTQMCTIADGQQGEGIAVAVEGFLNAEFYYGFSLIATWDTGSQVEVRESAGFLHVDGTTSATYTIAGIGSLDASKKNSGDTMSHSSGKSSIGGHSVYHGWASFVPYMESAVKLKTLTDTGTEVSFNGYMETKSVADWGSSNVHFPDATGDVTPKALQLSRNNAMTPLGDADLPSSTITLSNDITLGLSVNLAFSRPWQNAVGGSLPDMSVQQSIAAVFQIDDSGDEVCLSSSVIQTQYGIMTDGNYAGWGSDKLNQYVTKANSIGTSQCFTADSDNVVDRSIGDSVTSEGESISEFQDEDSEKKKNNKKKKRQNNSTPPDNFSGFDGLPDLSDLISDLNNELAGSSRTPEINCNGCGSCVITLDSENGDCCGCAWLAPDLSYDDDMWGYVSIDGTLASTYKRSAVEEFEEVLTKRVAGDITVGAKEIKLWNPTTDETAAPVTIVSEDYPSYPDYYRTPGTTKNWDISPYTSVKKYFHNSSTTCTSFDVAQATTYDVMYPWPKKGYQGYVYKRGTGYHQIYDTEHVMEGQTIGRFFMTWMPYSATRTRAYFWSESYILSTFAAPPLNGQAWIHLIVDELGSVANGDRLTIFLRRPNVKKGQLFGGKVSVTQATFAGREKGAEQLLEARETGMIFPYMNDDDVWQSFCDSYNGILDVLTQFDGWYQDLTGADSFLADEWPKFIRSELDMAVTRARKDLKMMDQNREAAGILYTQRWATIMAVNGGEIQKVKLDRVDICRNLPGTTVGPYTG